MYECPKCRNNYEEPFVIGMNSCLPCEESDIKALNIFSKVLFWCGALVMTPILGLIIAYLSGTNSSGLYVMKGKGTFSQDTTITGEGMITYGAFLIIIGIILICGYYYIQRKIRKRQERFDRYKT